MISVLSARLRRDTFIKAVAVPYLNALTSSEPFMGHFAIQAQASLEGPPGKRLGAKLP